MTKPFMQASRDPHSETAGFSLLELLLALSLGIGLSGAILQLLISESDVGLRVNRLLRERSVQQRTIALIRDDVQRSNRISANPQLEQHACNLGGRLPVLHLNTAAGPITYSVGTAPSAIWRGQVLMRCGPAFDLAGQPSMTASAQNRVVIDGLAVNPDPWRGCSTMIAMGASNPVDLSASAKSSFSGCLGNEGRLLSVRLMAQLRGSARGQQSIGSEALISMTP